MIYTTHTSLSPLCLHDPHEAWSPVRVTHPLSSAYIYKHGRQSVTHPLPSLPTRPARSIVAGQSLSQTPSLLSAYKTRTKHGRRSESHTLSPLRLQDLHEAWSPVRVTHNPRSPLCLQGIEAWSPVRVQRSCLSSTILSPLKVSLLAFKIVILQLTLFKVQSFVTLVYQRAVMLAHLLLLKQFVVHSSLILKIVFTYW